MKKKWKKSPYFKASIYAFCTIAACILFYQLSRDFSFIGTFFGYLTLILGPVLYGCVIAYLLNPLLNFYELTVFSKVRWKKRVCRTISLICTYLSALIILGILGLLIVPQLISSIDTMVGNVPVYTTNVQNFVEELYQKVETLAGSQQSVVEQLDKLIEGTKNSILDLFSSLVGAFPGIVTFLSDFTTEVTNVIVGIVISVYLLMDKERFAAQCKKVCCSFLSRKTVVRLVDFTHDMHESVGGFIIAKIFDGVIVGILSFIVFSIFGVPFALLLSVILAVCNIIPFFGQIIGPVIGALILLVISPEQVVWFILMCFIIMQVDGNLIGPRLIGKRIGISSFWIIVSLLAAGRMFGFWGMFLGAPVFAVLYGIFKHLVEKRLRARDCPPDTEEYLDFLHEPPRGIVKVALPKQETTSGLLPKLSLLKKKPRAPVASGEEPGAAAKEPEQKPESNETTKEDTDDTSDQTLK